MDSDLSRINGLIRTIPDFPKPGIMFRDITTLILDPWGFKKSVDLLSEAAFKLKPQKIIGIESRGFVFGAAVADRLECGLVLARKKGKLPGPTHEVEYDLEYGSDCIQIHQDAVDPGERCLIIDDLLATGGTASATAELIENMGAQVVGCHFVINLPDLSGASKLSKYDVKWLVEFAGH
jgi:adenine phosphoribosyltransferase